MRKVFVLLIIVSYASPCERFTFEEDFDELFSTGLGFCSFIDGTWVIGTFESMNMKGFHERSTRFIYPNEQTSCVSSPPFDMDSGGIIEVNIFMANHVANDLIQVVVLDGYAEVGTATESGHDFAGGWGTIQITIVKSSTFRGVISILGTISATSIILVDSFRYIPPGISKSDCLLYETDDENTTDDTICENTDDPADYTTGDMMYNNTHNTTDDTSYETTTGDAINRTVGTTFAVTEDTTDDTTDYNTNDGTIISDVIRCMLVCMYMMYIMCI